jgi:3-hydroxy-9,10-secoandrosta-1,3,5(10)-triene-9,17-dione monooxygenase
MQPVPKTSDPTEAELLQRARSLLPSLRERAVEADQSRCVPAATIEDIQAAGLMKILQPKRYGGYEMNPRVFYEVQMTLAEGCMSTAWVYGVLGVHPWQLALFDVRAQDEVWGSDSSTLIGSTYMPVGKVTRVDGGFKLSGRWAFSSGCDHVAWIFLGAMVPPAEQGGAPEYRTFLLPKADFGIVDTWHTLGLKATGSQDIIVEDAFVPDYRTHRTRDDTTASRPGIAINKAPTYLLPFMQVFARAVSSACIGGLQGAVNTFRESASRQVSRNMLGRTADDPSAQVIIAEASAAVDHLKLTLARNMDAMIAYAERGEAAPIEDRLLYRYQSSQVPEICAQHVSKLLKSCGGSGVYLTHPVQRYFLDIHTARSHVANNVDMVGRNFGGVLLGLENKDPTV